MTSAQQAPCILSQDCTPAVLLELRQTRAEVVRLRVQQARTMAMLLALVRPMTAEMAAQIEARLMALDDDGAG